MRVKRMKVKDLCLNVCSVMCFESHDLLLPHLHSRACVRAHSPLTTLISAHTYRTATFHLPGSKRRCDWRFRRLVVISRHRWPIALLLLILQHLFRCLLVSLLFLLFLFARICNKQIYCQSEREIKRVKGTHRDRAKVVYTDCDTGVHLLLCLPFSLKGRSHGPWRVSGKAIGQSYTHG